MKITETILEETIIQIAGKEAVPIYRLLKNRSNVNEFELTDKLKLSINEIRNILYKFDHYNLLSSERKKDRKKGWYIYFLSFNSSRLKDLAVKLRDEKLRRLEKVLEVGGEEAYVCVNKCVKVNAITALEYDYTCPECSMGLNLEKAKSTVSIRKEIEKLRRELSK